MGPESSRGARLQPSPENGDAEYLNSRPDNDTVEAAPLRDSSVMRKANRVTPEDSPGDRDAMQPETAEALRRVSELIASLETAKQYELAKESGIDFDTIADIEIEMEGLRAFSHSVIHDTDRDMDDLNQQLAIFEGACHVLGRKSGLLIRSVPEPGFGPDADKQKNKKGQA